MPLPETFRALVLEDASGSVSASVRNLPKDSLPDGDVLVSVAYSSLNYKDALAVTNRGKIVRRFPMVPGIDFSGTVAETKSDRFKPGDKVVLTGWGVGEDHWGGLAQLARVKTDWLLALPEGLTLKRAMSIGTAGLTAMFCVMVLQEHWRTTRQGRCARHRRDGRRGLYRPDVAGRAWLSRCARRPAKRVRMNF